MCIDLEPKLCITGQGHILVSSIFWSWFLFPWPNLAQTLPNICRKVRSVTLNKVSMSDIRVIASWRYFHPLGAIDLQLGDIANLCVNFRHIFPLAINALHFTHSVPIGWRMCMQLNFQVRGLGQSNFKSPLKCFLI